MTVIGKFKPAGFALLATGALLTIVACTPTDLRPSAPSGTATSAPSISQTVPAAAPSATPSPATSPGASATVGALVSEFPKQLIPLMPGATVISSSFDKTSSPASAALVATIAAQPADVIAFYASALEAQGFKNVPGDAVGAIASKDFVRGDNETINITVVESSASSTFTIGANVAAESAK